MKNSCIALMIMGAFSSAAMAEDFIKLTGKAEIGFHAFRENGVSKREFQDAGSELNVVGQADLGNGLTALLQVNTDVKLDNSKGSDHFANGDTFVGLRGDFGTVKLGHGINAYGDGYFKANFYKYDISPASAGIPSGGGDNRGAFKYEAPLLDGLALSLSYAPGKDKTESTRATDAWAVSGTYEKGRFGMRLSQAGQSSVDGRSKQDTLLAFKLQPQPGLTLSLELDRSRNEAGQRQLASATYAEYKPARLGLRAGYLTARDAGFVASSRQRTALLGMDYDLSAKNSRFQTSLFAEFRSDKLDGGPRNRDLIAGVHIGF